MASESYKRFTTTKVALEQTQGQIAKMLSRYEAVPYQWTNWPHRLDLRFKYGDRPYLFSIPLTDDQANRTQGRVLFWYLSGLFEAVATGLFTANTIFLPFLEITKDGTLSEVVEDPKQFEAIRGVFGGQLALDAGEQT